MFGQENSNPYSLAKQVILLYALKRKVLDNLAKGDLEYFKENIFDFATNKISDCMSEIEKGKELTDGTKKSLDECFVALLKEREQISMAE